MTIWDWIREYRKRAQADGDKPRLRLTEIAGEAWEYYGPDTDPDRVLLLLRDGRRWAEELGELWWVLFFDEWRLVVLLYQKRDFRDVHDLAIANVLKVRSPPYAPYPGKFWTHRALKSVYQGIDPRGYADEIGELLSHIEEEFAPEGEERWQLLVDRCTLAYECRQLEEAYDFALQGLAAVDSLVPRTEQARCTASAYRYLAALAHERRDWDALREWALLGQEEARSANRPLLQAEFLMWQAMLARRGRDEKGARLLLKRQAISIVRRLRVPSDGPYWDALCAFYEVGGELELALRARQREFQSFAGRGLLGAECELLLKQCRLLSKLGRLGETDVARVRAAVARLRRPATYLAELERLLQGNADEE
jgi:hypothetical protein